MPTNFGFLQPEWPQLFESAEKAEAFVYPDPRTACFHARRTLELAMRWLYTSEAALRKPYSDSLSALVHEPTFAQLAGLGIQTKARLIVEHGNRAVHGTRVIQQLDALTAVRELFQVCFWLARTYARGAGPAADTPFLPMLLPRVAPGAPQSQRKLEEMAAELTARDRRLSEVLAEKLDLEAARETGRLALDEEITRLRAEIAEAKRANARVPDTHDYSEAETRDAYIDLLLREAGWPLEQKQDREYPVTGLPDGKGGRVDYVLWGADGRPLALVEAKRTRRDANEGQHQGRLYADALEAQWGQRPVIFCSNGYEHWMWDDGMYPPREVQGFLKRDELELLMQRRQTRRPLAEEAVDPAIAGRYYQERAVRRVGESFAQKQRRALLVMATGAGKTRTVIALCDVLMRAGWVKRVLFLADRTALVKQAANAFKAHLPASSPVNLVTERSETGRVYLSTYPTMMGLIDEMKQDGTRRFGTGHFDLIVVDEAHRSIYQKYGAIFDYFDALLVGLTATPRDEIDRNTYGLFALEQGVPTDEYPLDDAIRDGFLVPPKAVSVPLRFQREGIRYDDLTEQERDEWDALEWGEDGEVPDRVEAAAVNKWLFNRDTVDKVLQHLMERGQKVAGGDRLGKTIIFAKNHNHAKFIVEQFNRNYPELRGHFAQVIDNRVDHAQSLIDEFSQPEKMPHIAVSVDMLDTGIDVPEVVNLVFFKLVRSTTKFWQMLGRGTRLSPDLLAPGRHKQFFYIFDFCQNLEYFNQNPEASEGSVGESLGARLFRARVDLLAELDTPGGGREAVPLRRELAEYLRGQVTGMNLDNFLVRPKRRLVEKYAGVEAWAAIREEEVLELAKELAPLPTASHTGERPEVKMFDLLMLGAQLALLRGDARFEKQQHDVRGIASLLEQHAAIPSIAKQLSLIQEVQTDRFWMDASVASLEEVRQGLRGLVSLIEKRRQPEVITNFADSIGEGGLVDLPGFSAGVDAEKVREKALLFLRKYEDDAAVHKLKWNEPLTVEDLAALERIFTNEGSSPEELEAARGGGGLGLFVRSLVGLDREAAKRAFAGFSSGGTLTVNQLEFVNLIINHLTRRGWMDPSQLYSSPFVDRHPASVDGLFDGTLVSQLVAVLASVKQNATPPNALA